MNLGTATIIQGDARHLPLADASVDLVVTSPPYFALRSYQDGGEHYEGQIGSEPSPTEFLDALLDVTAECVRVLKPSGSIFVNLGDKYAGSNGQSGGGGKSTLAGAAANARGRDEKQTPKRGGFVAGGAPAKSLIGIPWRYAIRCIDDLGLILRAEIIWSKPNGLPESVTDRVRRSHEQWFHFTVQPRYYSAVDHIREPHAEVSIKRAMPHRADPGRRGVEVYGDTANAQTLSLTNMNHPLGKLPGSVWTIPTEPLTVPDHLGIDHFAAYPTAWPKRIIQGWSPAGICVECDQGRRPVVFTERLGDCLTRRSSDRGFGVAQGVNRNAGSFTIVGEECGCPNPTAPTRPAVILDPFGGTGTTALAAKALGRHGISIDMSADYTRLAQWRTNDRNQLAKILGHEKITTPDPEQMGLFA